MAFNDPSWVTDERRTERRAERRRTDPTITIAVGVAIGVLVGGLALYGIQLWHTQRMIDQAARSAQQVFKQSAEAMAKARREAMVRQAAAEERQLAENARRRAALAEQQRADTSRRKAEIEEATRKELAWSRYYRKPARCDSPPDGPDMVSCANEFIRAKRSFESLYAGGKL